jgi:hypothetical protein
MGLEKAVQLVTDAKPKQPLQLSLGQMAALVFLQGKQLKRSSGQIAGRGTKTAGEIVWNFNRQPDWNVFPLS